jgi:nitrate/nitrite-specific signal transduction histidine kinase
MAKAFANGGSSLTGIEAVSNAVSALHPPEGRNARQLLAMSQIGPAIVFPLGAAGNVRGVLTVGRRHGAAPFPAAQADVVASFAAQAGVALELAASRADAERLSLFEDRDRIARDLHDIDEMAPVLGFAPSLRLGAGLAWRVPRA